MMLSPLLFDAAYAIIIIALLPIADTLILIRQAIIFALPLLPLPCHTLLSFMPLMPTRFRHFDAPC